MDEEKKIGRPKLRPDLKRSAAVLVRFTEAEAAEVEAAAAGERTATWARERLLEAARRPRP